MACAKGAEGAVDEVPRKDPVLGRCFAGCCVAASEGGEIGIANFPVESVSKVSFAEARFADASASCCRGSVVAPLRPFKVDPGVP